MQHNTAQTIINSWQVLALYVIVTLLGQYVGGIGGMIAALLTLTAIIRTIRRKGISTTRKIVYSVLLFLSGILLMFFLAYLFLQILGWV